jgi:NADH-quinone oxidoreductase subunit N
MIAAIATPNIDWTGLAPALVPLGGASLSLLGSVVVPTRARRAVSALIVALAFVAMAAAAAYVYWKTPEGRDLVGEAARRDRLAALAQAILAGVALLTIGVAWSDRPNHEHTGEYFALLAAAVGGMAFMVQANDLMTLFLGLEWFSLCLYVLCAIDIDLESSLESGLKYLIVGSFGSAILLFGSALVFGATDALAFGDIGEAAAGELSDDPMLVVGLAMIITGLGFKASAAPFHMWTPDVYQGSPTPVTAFMSAATKVVALVAALRILTVAFPAQEELWTAALAAVAIASLAVGNLAALVQRNVKRMLAYSSVSHAGFMLIPIAAANELGVKALLFYLVPYSAASLGAFAVIAARERELAQPVTLENLGGMGWERPFLGVAMWIFVLSFAGLPLTGGFFGKFYAFSAAVERDWIWLVIAGVIATAISLYYYLAIIRSIYMRSEAELRLAPVGGAPPRELALQASVAVCVVVTVGSFFAVQPLVELAERAAASLPL